MSINVSQNDDYAGIWTDEYEAYYGYEVTKCPIHGMDSEACDEADCDEGEWCFRFVKGEKEIIYTTSELEESVPDCEKASPSSYLMAGLGMLIDDGHLDLR